ncbi:MAG: SPFH domain-containing protein [Hahellaceae bacterium]|nr:SPFH domain-containing protein [Hahellaceae bacterium]
MFRYIKTEPSTYLMKYRKGRLVKEGIGLSCFYFAPTTSLVAIPMESRDLPFIFNEVSADFQTLSIQGQLVYRIKDPKQLAAVMNFTLAKNGADYASEAPKKLPGRLLNLVQVQTRNFVQTITLKEALSASEGLVNQLNDALSNAPVLDRLGIEVLDVSILAIKPNAETARALESTIREQLLKEADEAIYDRRNAALEQERGIKENELETEKLVEEKKQQVKEAEMAAKMAVQLKRQEMQRAELESTIQLEEQRQMLVDLSTQNARKEADAKAYAIDSTMRAMAAADSRVLEAITNSGMKPEQLIALSFSQIAKGADKIGQLNISPDLMRELMGNSK